MVMMQLATVPCCGLEQRTRYTPYNLVLTYSHFALSSGDCVVHRDFVSLHSWYITLVWDFTKVLEVLADSRGNVETPDDLYDLAREIEWTSLLLPESSAMGHSYDNNGEDENGAMTLSVEAVLGQTSMDLRHSHFCALTVKNAAVDACREDPNNKQGQRPNVSTQTHLPDQEKAVNFTCKY